MHKEVNCISIFFFLFGVEKHMEKKNIYKKISLRRRKDISTLSRGNTIGANHNNRLSNIYTYTYSHLIVTQQSHIAQYKV